MKRILSIVRVFFIFILILSFTCDHKFRNPLDPDTEIKPDEWAPSNLTATVIDDSHIRLTWTQEESKIGGFVIERKDGASDYKEVGRTDTTVFIDDSLVINIGYTYKITAFAEKNLSTPVISQVISTSFPAPTGLNATVIDDQTIRLTWTDHSSFESGFRIERKTGTGSYTQIAELSANAVEYTNAGLAYGETYTYRVRSFTSINQSSYSNENSAQMVIPAPTNLMAAAIDDQTIKLTWIDNCAFEAGYRIERKTGTGSYIQIAELDANTTSYEESGLTYGEIYTYRVRTFTLNNQSDYSNEMVDPWHVIDVDGNIYRTVKIGAQVWMAENLKVTHCRNGDAIPNVTDATEWCNLTTGAYCNYANNASNADTYGSLYNWYAVSDSLSDSRNVAPAGWHVPSDAEWQTLVDYLGGEAVAGGKMKEAGTIHWNSPNIGATNESGFSALPGGYRNYGGYGDVGSHAYFWSSTDYDSYSASSRSLNLSYSSPNVFRDNYSRQIGHSVRCVRD